MSDQPNMESPQSRLEAMLGDIQDETLQPPVDEQQEEPQEVEEELEEEVGEEEVVTEDSEDETEDEELAETDDEVGEEESDEEQPVESVKLKVNGEEIEKSLDEVVALAQQGLDYTKKTQEVAERRKELESLENQIRMQEQNLQQQSMLNSELIQDVAKITALDQQLSEYQDVNWEELSDSDFVTAQKKFFTFNQLQQQRSNLVSQFESKRQEALNKQQQMVAEKVAKGKEVLAKEIPNWSPETTQEIISTGRDDYGFTDAELNSIIDPRHVRVLHDAMQWRKLKSKNSVVKKKVSRAKPVVKPGSKDPSKVVNSNAKKMREQLRKSGSSEVASKLIEDMI
jgi:DNA repair exonuclease SbcCD ATPase subunit